MINKVLKNRLFLILSAFSFMSSAANAAVFQMTEQDAASLGHYHAGQTAGAEDASTAFYNPAGLIRIKNQQIIGGGAFILPTLHFRGTVAVNTLSNPAPQPVSAEGGGYQFAPFVHYAAPISDNIVFGLSYVERFGFKTDFGASSLMRYAATFNSIEAYDLTPSLGMAFGDKFSVGFGVDMEHLSGDFNHATTAPGQTVDTLSNNSGNNNAFGYHLGALFQFTPKTRIGLSYHSQIVHQLNGNSQYIGPLASGGTQQSLLGSARVTLPPTTSLGIFHAFTSLDIMGNVAYTQWDMAKYLILNNVIAMQGGAVTNNNSLTVYQNFRNTWNYSVGADYHFNDQFMLRTGLGYDQSPAVNSSRSMPLPDSNQIAVALGMHYQATETLAFDAGWTHLFVKNTQISNVSQTVGDQTVVTNGGVRANTDIYGLQAKWDIV